MESKQITINNEIYHIYKALKGYEMTNHDNFNAYIMNANQISKFHTFDSLESVVEYCKKYFGAKEF